MNNLLNKLREKDKSGMFSSTAKSMTYSTGFDVLDHFLGYITEVRNEETNEVISTQKRLGFESGGFITVVGLPGTAKSTLLVQVAYKIIREFEDMNGIIYHMDVEQAANEMRIKNITGMTQKFYKNNYVLTQEVVSIQDAYTAIKTLAQTKIDNIKEYSYTSDTLDEYGKPKVELVPTVIIIDSLASLLDSSSIDKVEMDGNTHAARVARTLSSFVKELGPFLKKSNTMVLMVNHLKTKMSMNGMPTQSDTPYMKNDETAPGGKGPFYHSHLYMKLSVSKKYTMDKDGFEGMIVNVFGVKTRTANASGKYISLFYEPTTGFNRAKSLLYFAENNGLIEGRNPYLRFKGSEIKFNRKNFDRDIIENPQLLEDALTACKPLLDSMIGYALPEDSYEKEDEN